MKLETLLGYTNLFFPEICAENEPFLHTTSIHKHSRFQAASDGEAIQTILAKIQPSQVLAVDIPLGVTETPRIIDQ